MSLYSDLLSIYNSQKLPDYTELLVLADKSVNIMEKEDSFYRPEEKSKEKLSGGLLSFLNEDEAKPVIVVPDLHARGYFLLHLLNCKICLSPESQEKVSVIDALENNSIYLVCVGDLFHSELRSYARWKKALASFQNGNILSPEMNSEMLENLNLLQMILKLKLACPHNFHFLKGNHENILNEEGRGNHPFYKMAAEGEMFYQFMGTVYDDALIYVLSLWEHALPVCAVFKNLVVSHAEPAFTMNKRKIINYRQNPDVVYGLTWTGNDCAERSSVSKSIRNLVGKNCRDVVWIGGHRPVTGKYALRQRGKYIQIHNPDEENIAVIYPDTKFNPETGIFSVKDCGK